MDTSLILQLAKSSLGISSSVRDAYITAIVNGIIKELEDEKGLVLDGANPYHQMFLVDYTTWRYQNKDNHEGMPRHLQYRLRNLFIHVGSSNLKVYDVEVVDSLPSDPSKYTVYILSLDRTKQMYINGAWTLVKIVNGVWRVVE
jgi:hypothetical protein